MDDLDRQLIAELRRDARLPVSTLATRLGTARATVRSRIDRLVASGVISGFTVTLGAEVPAGIRAIMMIEVEGQSADRVMRQLAGLPEVVRLHSTNGRWDIVADLEAADLGAFDRLLGRIRLVTGIAATETSILLARHG